MYSLKKAKLRVMESPCCVKNAVFWGVAPCGPCSNPYVLRKRRFLQELRGVIISQKTSFAIDKVDSKRFWRWCINNQNYWDFGLCSVLGMLRIKKHHASGTGSVSVRRWEGEKRTLLDPLE
jgi:hypothetical protein